MGVEVFVQVQRRSASGRAAHGFADRQPHVPHALDSARVRLPLFYFLVEHLIGESQQVFRVGRVDHSHRDHLRRQRHVGAAVGRFGVGDQGLRLLDLLLAERLFFLGSVASRLQRRIFRVGLSWWCHIENTTGPRQRSTHHQGSLTAPGR